tara:strand:- start:98 stop:241 length:144 start_codon:yes stop_codon:yes gene_type:complete
MIRRAKKSELDNALLFAKLKETIVEPSREYACPQYRLLFHATSLIDS